MSRSATVGPTTTAHLDGLLGQRTAQRPSLFHSQNKYRNAEREPESFSELVSILGDHRDGRLFRCLLSQAQSRRNSAGRTVPLPERAGKWVRMLRPEAGTQVSADDRAVSLDAPCDLSSWCVSVLYLGHREEVSLESVTHSRSQGKEALMRRSMCRSRIINI